MVEVVEITVGTVMTAEAMTEAIKVETGKAADLKETTVGVEMTEAPVIGIVQNVTTQTLLSGQNVIDVENLVVQVVEITVGTVMTAEEMTAVTKAETDKADDLKETTVIDKMTEVLVTGTVRSVTTQTLHSEPNAIAVVNPVALGVETTVDAETTEELSLIHI